MYLCFVKKSISNLIKRIIFISSALFLFFAIIVFINRKQVYPSILEQKSLNQFFSNKEIKNEKDIIYVQNRVVKKIAHKDIAMDRINIINNLKLKEGFCYDRSLILQKYFLMKGFKIRPVYLFYGINNTSFLDLFKSSTQSHNIFEIYFNSHWYMIKTNTKMTRLESLSQYLIEGKVVPPHTKYIRYLNNRNGRFIYPSFIPDIYFF